MKHSKDLHLLVVVSQYTHETLKDLHLLVVVSQYTHEALKRSTFTCSSDSIYTCVYIDSLLQVNVDLSSVSCVY
jgi:hypothetical protein